MKPYIKITLFIMLAVAVITILTALIAFNKKHADTAKVKPDFVITATTLQKEFEDNEAAASVNCVFPATGDLSKFRPGDEITLRGECSGFLMDVLLKNCAVITKRN